MTTCFRSVAITQPAVWLLCLPWFSGHTWWLINFFSASCLAWVLHMSGDLGETQILAGMESLAEPEFLLPLSSCQEIPSGAKENSDNAKKQGLFGC